MTLVDLVIIFRKGKSFQEFCSSNSLNSKSEVIEIYMEKPYKLDNMLAFFEIEKTSGNVEYISNGIKFYNLFDFYYFLDAMEELAQSANKLLTDSEIAEKLLSNAIHDA